MFTINVLDFWIKTRLWVLRLTAIHNLQYWNKLYQDLFNFDVIFHI